MLVEGRDREKEEGGHRVSGNKRGKRRKRRKRKTQTEKKILFKVPPYSPSRNYFLPEGPSSCLFSDQCIHWVTHRGAWSFRESVTTQQRHLVGTRPPIQGSVRDQFTLKPKGILIPETGPSIWNCPSVSSEENQRLKGESPKGEEKLDFKTRANSRQLA